MKSNTLTTNNTQEKVLKEALEAAITYSEYRELVSAHVANGTSTGPSQTEALIAYNKLNDARMRRLDKTIKISEKTQQLFSNYTKKVTWLVLTEGWCGDAAQALPVLHKLANISPNLNLKIVLRDDHIALMNYFLTNGGMSIPKLLVVDNASQVVLGEWGPRPSTAAIMVEDFKAKNGVLTPKFKQDLQVWYTKDKGVSIIEDIERLLK